MIRITPIQTKYIGAKPCKACRLRLRNPQHGDSTCGCLFHDNLRLMTLRCTLGTQCRTLHKAGGMRPYRPGLEALVVRLQQVHHGRRRVLELLVPDVRVRVRRPRQVQAQPQHLARVKAPLPGARQRQRLAPQSSNIS